MIFPQVSSRAPNSGERCLVKGGGADRKGTVGGVVLISWNSVPPAGVASDGPGPVPGEMVVFWAARGCWWLIRPRSRREVAGEPEGDSRHSGRGAVSLPGSFSPGDRPPPLMALNPRTKRAK